MGQIGILNVGAGDTKLTFDKNDPVECIRAAHIVKDMLRRGYVLLVDVGDGKYQRVLEFREDVYEYVIADFDSATAAVVDNAEEQQTNESKGGKEGTKERAKEESASSVENASEKPIAARKQRGRPVGSGRRSISATSTNGIAVARTAGG